MKVHPAMLMKTNKSRFQVSGGDILLVGEDGQDGAPLGMPPDGISPEVDENKEEQVSDVRCQEIEAECSTRADGWAMRNTPSTGYPQRLMKIKRQQSEVRRCQGAVRFRI
jgi:hypothetical protein